MPEGSPFLQGQGLTVAQREIPAKTNEIPEINPRGYPGLAVTQLADLVPRRKNLTGAARRTGVRPARRRDAVSKADIAEVAAGLAEEIAR
jgi:hypothetical protein